MAPPASAFATGGSGDSGSGYRRPPLQPSLAQLDSEVGRNPATRGSPSKASVASAMAGSRRASRTSQQGAIPSVEVRFGAHRASVEDQEAQRQIMSHAFDLQLACEEQEALNTMLRVRQVQALAPFLWQRMHEGKLALLASCWGVWVKAGLLALRRKAVQDEGEAEQAARLSEALSARASASMAGGLGASHSTSAKQQEWLGVVLEAWKTQAAVTGRRREGLHRALGSLNEASFWLQEAILAIFQVWHTNTLEEQVEKKRNAARGHRRQLLVKLSEAKNEVADMVGKLHFAQQRCDASDACAEQALALLYQVVDAADLKPGVVLARDAGQSDPAAALEEISALVALRTEIQEKLAKAQTFFFTACADSGPVNTLRAMHREHSRYAVRPGFHAPDHAQLCESLNSLRVQKARLQQDLLSERRQFDFERSALSLRKEAELKQEREKTRALTQRLDDARDLVGVLSVRHRQLLAAEVGPEGPHEEVGLPMGSHLPDVQKALCALAEVSEELLQAR